MSLLACHEKLDPELIDEIIRMEFDYDYAENIYKNIFGPDDEYRNEYSPNLFIDVVFRLLPQLKLLRGNPLRLSDGTHISEDWLYPLRKYQLYRYSPEEIQNGWYPEKYNIDDIVYAYQDFISINSLFGDFLSLRSYLDCGGTYEDYGYENDKPEYVYQVMHPKFLEAVFLLI